MDQLDRRRVGSRDARALHTRVAQSRGKAPCEGAARVVLRGIGRVREGGSSSRRAPHSCRSEERKSRGDSGRVVEAVNPDRPCRETRPFPGPGAIRARARARRRRVRARPAASWSRRRRRRVRWRRRAPRRRRLPATPPRWRGSSRARDLRRGGRTPTPPRARSRPGGRRAARGDVRSARAHWRTAIGKSALPRGTARSARSRISNAAPYRVCTTTPSRARPKCSHEPRAEVLSQAARRYDHAQRFREERSTIRGTHETRAQLFDERSLDGARSPFLPDRGTGPALRCTRQRRSASRLQPNQRRTASGPSRQPWSDRPGARFSSEKQVRPNR